MNNKEANFNMFIAKVADLELMIIYDDDFFLSEKNWSINSHYHNNFECIYIYQGTAELNVDNTTIDLRNNDLCIIPPFTNHYVKSIKNECKKCSFLFNINPQTGDKENSINLYYTNILNKINSIHIINNSNSYEEFFKPASNFLTQSNIYSYINKSLLFISFFIDTIKKIEESKEAELLSNKPHNSSSIQYTKHFRLMLIEQYLQNHYTEPIAIEDIAKYLHLSKRQTERTILELTGKTFTELLIQLRMNKALELIQTSNMKLEEIAYQIGYSSYSSFHKQFLNFFNITPKKIPRDRINGRNM